MWSKIIRAIQGLILLIIVSMLTGCSDMTQIENREFVMGIAVSYEENQFIVTFQRPDLSSLTGQSVGDDKELLVTYSAESLSRIKEEYAKSSEKRLDFSHLKVIIFDEKIANNKVRMEEFLRYIENDHEISRNTLVFYTTGEQKSISGRIGEELEQLYENNPTNIDTKKVTIGEMINCLYQPEKVIVIPHVEISKEKVTLEGAGIFQKNQYISQNTEDELTQWNMLQGKGTKRCFTLPQGEVVKIEELKVRYQYSMKEGIPLIQIYLLGKGELVEGRESSSKELEDELNGFLKRSLVNQIKKVIVGNQIDYLNLYRRMSYANQDMWRAYKGKQEQFLQDLDLDLEVSMVLAKY